jgi:hypothetical protein
MRISSEKSLFRLRGELEPLEHDDARLDGSTVTVYCGRRRLRVECDTPELAAVAEKISAGIRFRRETIAETFALERRSKALEAA